MHLGYPLSSLPRTPETPQN